MISPIQAFSFVPILPVSRLRATAAAPSEELAKNLRVMERANERASLANNYTVPVPQASYGPYANRTEDTAGDGSIGGRTRRYVRDETAETSASPSSSTSAGLFSFGPSLAPAPSSTLASVQPVQAQLDSASFLSLYASNDTIPARSAEQRLAQPFQAASNALASRFAFGEELALSIAA